MNDALWAVLCGLCSGVRELSIGVTSRPQSSKRYIYSLVNINLSLRKPRGLNLGGGLGYLMHSYPFREFIGIIGSIRQVLFSDAVERIGRAKRVFGFGEKSIVV